MFKLTLIRCTVVGARQWAAGAELLADAHTARALIEAGTARLSAEADLPRLVAALRGNAAGG